MLGMDLVAIVTAALAGAAGGLLGALIASLLPASAKGLRAGIIAGFVVTLPTIAKPALTPYVEQYAGTWLRSGQFDAVYEKELESEFKQIPAIERVFRDHPETKTNFMQQARQAFDEGGAKLLLERAPGIGASTLSDALLLYMPRARSEDLVLFASTMADTLSWMNERDPESCILFQFGTKFGKPLPNSRMVAAIGKDGLDKILSALNAVVINATDHAPAYDKQAAEAAVKELAQRHAPLLTGTSSEVATGARLYKDKAEAAVACGFATAMFKDLATMDRAKSELILRHLYSS